ncbi:hypothetical protein QQG55_16225 [Brugia pahangi]
MVEREKTALCCFSGNLKSVLNCVIVLNGHGCKCIWVHVYEQKYVIIGIWHNQSKSKIQKFRNDFGKKKLMQCT